MSKRWQIGLHPRHLDSVTDDISLCLVGRLPKAIRKKSLCGGPDPLGPAQPAPAYRLPSSLSQLLSSILCGAGRPVEVVLASWLAKAASTSLRVPGSV